MVIVAVVVMCMCSWSNYCSCRSSLTRCCHRGSRCSDCSGRGRVFSSQSTVFILAVAGVVIVVQVAIVFVSGCSVSRSSSNSSSCRCSCSKCSNSSYSSSDSFRKYHGGGCTY